MSLARGGQNFEIPTLLLWALGACYAVGKPPVQMAVTFHRARLPGRGPGDNICWTLLACRGERGAMGGEEGGRGAGIFWCFLWLETWKKEAEDTLQRAEEDTFISYISLFSPLYLHTGTSPEWSQTCSLVIEHVEVENPCHFWGSPDWLLLFDVSFLLFPSVKTPSVIPSLDNYGNTRQTYWLRYQPCFEQGYSVRGCPVRN